MSDWDSVTVLRKKAPKSSTLKTESAVNQARRQGVAVDTQQKCECRPKISSSFIDEWPPFATTPLSSNLESSPAALRGNSLAAANFTIASKPFTLPVWTPL